ncbi:hypothetical protein PVAP13_7KG363001 [Panicum virgatum]|uniref:Peroxidase n=1 Tax=Panicum virgatum TaxID=38727 RepID=A0A8T0QS81_PANVG|nr:hypothetical protein PVAP13_7KG363001 [Panicum virgatum]
MSMSMMRCRCQQQQATTVVLLLLAVSASASARPLTLTTLGSASANANANANANATNGLSVYFHLDSCPQLETIVRSHVDAALRQNVRLTAGLLRVFFHDCFPQGCDASILLDNGERNLPPNVGLQQEVLQLIEDARAKVHAQCGATVSCADITVPRHARRRQPPPAAPPSRCPSAASTAWRPPPPTTTSSSSRPAAHRHRRRPPHRLHQRRPLRPGRPRLALRRPHRRQGALQLLRRRVRARRRRRHQVHHGDLLGGRQRRPAARPRFSDAHRVRQPLLRRADAQEEPGGDAAVGPGAGHRLAHQLARPGLRRQPLVVLRPVQDLHGEDEPAQGAPGERRRGPPQLLQAQRRRRRRGPDADRICLIRSLLLVLFLVCFIYASTYNDDHDDSSTYSIRQMIE